MTLKQAIKIIGGLSEPSKMPCFAFSTSPRKCKRGNKLKKIANSICSFCYAGKGHFRWPSTEKAMLRNGKKMNHPRFIEAMAFVLNKKEKSGFFRWYGSGDAQSLFDFVKIAAIARLTPHINHWVSTRESGFLGAFKRAGFSFPENVTIRLSADMLEQRPSESLMTQLNVVGSMTSKTSWDCPAYTQGHKCLDCRKCWDKTVKVVTYKKI